MPTLIDVGDSLDIGGGLLRLPRMTDEEYGDFCRRNPDLRVEQNEHGDIVLMAPTGGETGIINTRLLTRLETWAERDGTGVAFDSSTQFILPNGAKLSPDMAWISFVRWNALTKEQQIKFPPLCPDFVVELMSPSDTLSQTQGKMEQYHKNGARLGWLIDRKRRKVHIYRPGQSVQILSDPAEVSGDPELPGFLLKMNRIFDV